MRNYSGSSERLELSMVCASSYELYQLSRDTYEQVLFRYMSYDWMKEHGYAIDSVNYELVYSGDLDPDTNPEDIFRKFNLDKPADYNGHSMSVSDVVVFDRDGYRTAYYCDRFGFREIEWGGKNG